MSTCQGTECRAARRWRSQLRTLAGGCLALFALSGEIVQAKPPVATNSPAARREAISAIPFDKIETGMRRKVSAVVTNPSIYRRLPVQVTDCDPDMYLFLVRHPEVVVNIWQVMGISKVKLEQIDDESFKAADGAGTSGTVKYCYSNHDTQVIYSEGAYEGPLFEKPLTAKCVLVLKSGYVQETNGRYYVTSRLDTFITIDNAGVELLAKTLQPLLSRSADYNFVETSAFLGNISRTAETNGPGVERLSNKLTSLNPETRDRFAELSLAVSEKKSRRQHRSASAAPARSALRTSATVEK